ncbi:tetraprenyl-beta-curcumene synthase family protein [Evansella sp. AB-P1]|uniref:tetraprenyl-beta-curcumene synthase family protein n=1 Tax=Evansella sp. AB-P1 TaxID=3037653 RepID=UPI00241E08CE|nr:tetraprenyl-beta-curcumene synthase family protein [Evansella sp. AB-P1]MDG5787759.1 tetraprenyl-beta-curcumene synthase family protein [Evansella sp. AB-P1]
MSIPTTSWTLMYQVYKKVLPKVHEFLNIWKEKAKDIPDPELRQQALASIETKTFHCEGGAIYGLLAQEKRVEAIKFIVAYQTISDYLDNLCDRSTSLDPNDFRALHESMPDALTPNAAIKDYYRYREEKNDGGYLASLVKTCQDCIKQFPSYEAVQESNITLAELYSDLQVHKHVKLEERVPRLEAWFKQHKQSVPPMSWYEFSASCGSTLGIFCLTSYSAANENMTLSQVNKIKAGYFPWVQGLHILMDYFIDQEEDKAGGDLNFCFYYENEDEMIERMKHFYFEADRSIRNLPDWKFHRLINNGLLAIYLADDKVKNNPDLKKKGNEFIRSGGAPTLFFYINGWIYRRKSGT